LLAQTRQADRDKVHSDADAQHREELAKANEQRQSQVAEQTATIVQLLNQNTELTQTVKNLAEQIAALTTEVHNHVKGTQ
jgi:cell division protein FtsB